MLQSVIAPQVRERLHALFSTEEQDTMEKLLPLAETYIEALTTSEDPDHTSEGYPFTLSKYIELCGLNEARRSEHFKGIAKSMNLDSHGIAREYNSKGVKGKPIEIYFTPRGFWGVFNEGKTEFAQKVRRLKDAFMHLGMMNLTLANQAEMNKMKSDVDTLTNALSIQSLRVVEKDAELADKNEELKETNAELRNANTKLVKSNRELNEYTEMLRTGVTKIILQELLITGHLNERERRLLYAHLHLLSRKNIITKMGNSHWILKKYIPLKELRRVIQQNCEKANIIAGLPQRQNPWRH